MAKEAALWQVRAPFRMRLSFLAPLLALVLLTGCKDNCRQLAESLCNCAANTSAKNNCLTGVANRASNIGVSSDQDNYCGQLLPLCDCHTVNTVQGKYACGLARLPIP